jgi:hypothetical protein
MQEITITQFCLKKAKLNENMSFKLSVITVVTPPFLVSLLDNACKNNQYTSVLKNILQQSKPILEKTPLTPNQLLPI